MGIIDFPKAERLKNRGNHENVAVGGQSYTVVTAGLPVVKSKDKGPQVGSGKAAGEDQSAGAAQQ